MFVSNNGPSFHLWLEENLVKHQKVSKCYEKYCRFITKKWIEVHDQSGETYSPNKQIRFKTSMLRLDLCNYRDVYIVATEKIAVKNPNNDEYDKILAFKKNSPFVSCISKINNTLIDNAEDLDIVMPMYNLIE